MKRGLFVALLLAFLCCVLAAPASAQTGSPTINTLCSQCHPSVFLHNITAGNAYNCDTGGVGAPQCGWGPLVMRMDNNEGNTWSASDVTTMIAYLENNLSVANPAGSFPQGIAGTAYGPVTMTGVTTPGMVATGSIPGGTPPFTWMATSGLPTGMTLSAGGVLSGTPPLGSQGTYTVQITIQDSASPPTPIVLTTRTLVIMPPAALSITGPDSLSTGTVGTPYSPVLFTASGGVPPYTWSVSGQPNGTSIDSTGHFSGTPTASGTFNPKFTVKDSTNATVSVNLSLTINPAGGLSNPFPAGGLALSPSASSGSIPLTFPAGFAWAATTTASWITITGPASGVGSGSLNYQVTANPGADRSGSITIAGYSFIIQQEGGSIPGLNFIGSMAHVAAEENWTTTFTLVNKSAASATARLSIFGDASGPLTVPLAFPQQTGLTGPLLAASFDQTLTANASLIVNSAGPQTSPVLVGSAQLAATGAVDGFAIFHQIVTTQEAVVPMETRNASSYLLAFDNTTNGLALGVAVENVTAQNAVIPVIIRDDTGVVISAPGTTISLGGNGHTSFVLSTQFPITANIRGTIEFDTPAGGRISVLGLRFTPPNNALTTIPPLANVGTGGGSIAHLASGGDGWQTTFVLVNTGISAAQFTLSFFADQTGAPLNLPLSFPQSGSGNATVAPSITQILPAGATLLIVSSGAGQLLTGSAQLTTPGNISGFVIYRHNDQEAVVPLESRNPNAYVIAFDNTNGTATGIALNAVSTQAVSVPVVVRNDAGTQIATDVIALNPNGHTQFTLVTDKYPGTNGIRGTIEFDKPANGQIGALGIRIPTGAAHTYTTLPALAK